MIIHNVVVKRGIEISECELEPSGNQLSVRENTILDNHEGIIIEKTKANGNLFLVQENTGARNIRFNQNDFNGDLVYEVSISSSVPA